MAINAIVKYNDVFLPDILLLTRAPIVVLFDVIFIVYYYYLFNYVLHSTFVLNCFLAWHGSMQVYSIAVYFSQTLYW